MSFIDCINRVNGYENITQDDIYEWSNDGGMTIYVSIKSRNSNKTEIIGRYICTHDQTTFVFSKKFKSQLNIK